jgi:hypothetical protein
MRVTLDGFIAGPNGEMDWMEEFFDPSLPSIRNELYRIRFALLRTIAPHQSETRSHPAPAQP